MYPKSIINFVIHMAYFVACVFAMYSASVVDNVIVSCRLLLQEMAPPPCEEFFHTFHMKICAHKTHLGVEV